MSFTIMFPVYGAKTGAMYYLVKQAMALRRVAAEAGCRLVVVAGQGEQTSGLWEQLREAFAPEDIVSVGADRSKLTEIAIGLLEKDGRLLAHLQGTRQLLALRGLRKQYSDRLRIMYSVHSFRNRTWQAKPYSWLVAHLLRRYADFTLFHSPFAVRQFCQGRRMLSGGRGGLMPLALEDWAELLHREPAAGQISADLLALLEDPEAFRFLYLAMFVRSKGHTWLLEGLAPALRRHRNASVILAGGRNDRLEHELSELAKKLDIEHQVVMPGFIDRQVVPWLLSKCHAGIVASGSETFGYNYLEPMAAGLPVVGTRTGVGEWLIMDYHTGIGFRYRDRGGVRLAAEYLITHPAEAARLGRNGAELVRTLFTWETVTACHLRIYTSLMEQCRESGRC